MDEYILINGQLYQKVSAPQPPARVLGWAVGECKTFTQHGKSVFNKQAWKAGFRWNANRVASNPRRARDGAEFVVEHDTWLGEYRISRVA